LYRLFTMVTTPPRKSKIPNILGDWDDVRFFLAVAKTGSFSAAAAQLNTKQTTVGPPHPGARAAGWAPSCSTATRHGMEVTPAARGVLVQAVIDAVQCHVDRAPSGRPRPRRWPGVVRVAATEGLAAQWLVPRLTELRRRHSDIVVQVIVGDQVLDLATRQADLAIRFFRPTSHQLVAARVGQFNMSIFAAPAYIEQFGLPQEIDDLREHHLVDHTTLHSLPAMKPWSEIIERSSNVVLRTNSSHSAMEAGEGSLGNVDLPELQQQDGQHRRGADQPQYRARHLAGVA